MTFVDVLSEILETAVFVAIALGGRRTVALAREGIEFLRYPDRYQHRRALGRLYRALSLSEGLPGQEIAILDTLVEALGFAQAGLYHLDPSRGRLEWISGSAAARIPVLRSVPVSQVQDRSILVDGFTYGVPLASRRETVGMLVLGERPGGMHLDDAERMALAQTCAVLSLTLENQRLGRTLIDQKLAERKAQEERQLNARVNAVVSHQLKTPLLIGQAMLSDARESIDDRVRVARRLDKLIGSLTRFERNVMQNFDRTGIALDRFELAIAPTSLDALLARCLDEAAYALGKREIQLTYEVEPELAVLCDPARFEIVVDNLLSNSLKAMSEGGELRIVARREGSRAIVELSDDGPGICPERLPGLFEVQAPNPQDPTSTGIGLWICRQYLRAMGGDIELTQSGPGVTFRLQLPRATAGVHAQSAP